MGRGTETREGRAWGGWDPGPPFAHRSQQATPTEVTVTGPTCSS